MREVLRYLKKISDNIDTIWKLHREHRFLIEICEKHKVFTSGRLKQFKETNNKVSDIIIIEKFFD